jgi:hypothetical protein
VCTVSQHARCRAATALTLPALEQHAKLKRTLVRRVEQAAVLEHAAGHRLSALAADVAGALEHLVRDAEDLTLEQRTVRRHAAEQHRRRGRPRRQRGREQAGRARLRRHDREREPVQRA